MPDDLTGEGVEPGVMARFEATLAIARDLGATVERVPLPHADYGLSAYYVLAPAEASSNLARFDGVRYGLRRDADDLLTMYTKTRHDGFGAEVKRRILIGTYALSSGYYDAYYGRAQRVRTKIADDFRAAYERVDFIVTPDEPERRVRARRAHVATRWRCTSTTTSPSRSRSRASRGSRSRAG